MKKLCCWIADNPKPKPKESKNVSKAIEIQKKFIGNEFDIITLIYDDLAQRSQSNKINKENFLLYFNQTGQWGDRLFGQFDSDQSNLICKDEFLKGISLVFKTNEKEKIKLLFKYFSSQERTGIKGIGFNDLLIMLYNFPKQGLKKILNNEQFVNQQLKKKLIEIKKKNVQRLETTAKKSSRQHEGSQLLEYQIEESDDTQSQRPTSQYGFKPVFQQIEKNGTDLKLVFEGKEIEVKSVNIQHLVKKLTKSIFKENNVDLEYGKLSFEQFQKWIKNHRELYETYYGDFHNEIWEFDKVGRVPKYLTTFPEISSDAKTKIQGKQQQVFLILLHSTLIVTNSKQHDRPLSAIVLNGLAVKKCFNSAFGIQITHRQGHYKKRQFYFKNQDQVDKWMEHLKYYKGVVIHQLYEIGKKIGTGKFAVVYEGRQISTGKAYAIKVIKNNIYEESKAMIAHESSIMAILTNPFLAYYKQTIQSKTETYIIAQLVHGYELFQYVKIRKTLNQMEAARIARQLIIGVRHMHKMGIVHRDLKPQNIMIEQNAQIQSVKIIDFGLAAYLNRLVSMQDQQQLFVGTPGYMAPQIFTNNDITYKIDNFAIGGIIYYMLSGKLAFSGQDESEMVKKAMAGKHSFKGAQWKYISEQAKQLISRFLQASPQKRISLQQALYHPWFSSTNIK